ncbi:DUF6907 domain-containing protein [Microlunatus sagamiharensis]|uniref:DUF6907 domain-containing protein n=1 Tax=Microlunatus sagamiharensis TaxID=546874 RepID=UPI0038B23D73
MPTTTPCPPWCTRTPFHAYDCECLDDRWEREHVAFEWSMRLVCINEHGNHEHLEVSVVAEEMVVGEDVTHPLLRKPTMFVFAGDGNLKLTPAEARQWSAAMADAAGHLETALLHWDAARSA